MEMSEAEVLVQSHDLLRETMAYLQRLPLNPTTAQMVRKIQAHLEQPEKAILTRRAMLKAETAELMQVGLSGGWMYTPAGVPVLEMLIKNSIAKVKSPAAQVFGATAAGKAMSRKLFKALAEGIEINLSRSQPTSFRKL